MERSGAQNTEYVHDGSINFANDAFLRVLLEKVPLSKDMAVLDVGCGAGAYGIALAGMGDERSFVVIWRLRMPRVIGAV